MERNELCWFKDTCNQECSNNCIHYNEIKFLMENSGLPKNKQCQILLQPEKVDLEAFNTLAGINKNIKQFVEEGRNLYLYSSNTGNGKTSWSIKMLLNYFNSIWIGNAFRVRGLFIRTNEYLIKLKEFNKTDLEFEDLKKKVREADLVVWDDIGAGFMSNYDSSQLLDILDKRVFEGKSNILTSNLSPDNFEKVFGSSGAKIISRIASEYCIELKGNDRRFHKTLGGDSNG